MKRLLSIFLVTSLVLTLVASVAVADETKNFSNPSISVNLPTGWNAIRSDNDNNGLNGDKYTVGIYTTDTTDNKYVVLMLDDMVFNGETRTLEEVGNMWRTDIDSKNNPRRTDDKSHPGYYSYEYDRGKDVMIVIMYDNSYDSRVNKGEYFFYRYLSPEVTNDELSSITVSINNGSFSALGTGGGSGKMTGSGGGGCVTGSSALAMLGALVVFMKARKR